MANDGSTVGKVVDLALDLDQGYVAALLIAEQQGTSGAVTTAVPWQLVEAVESGPLLRLKISPNRFSRAPKLRNSGTLQHATRVWLSTVYQHYELEPYWNKRQQSSTWGKATDYGKLFNARAMQTVEGTIEDIAYVAPLDGMAVGTQLTLRTDQGMVQAQLGPLAYLSEHDVSFEKGETVKVTGSAIMLSGSPVLMATEVKTGDRRLQLRQPDGTPHWPEWTEQDAQYLPASLKGLIGTSIENAQGETLGRIADFAIAGDRGRIAYVAMTCTCFEGAADRLYPVPLPAFVVRPGASAWLLELPLDVLENMKPFPVRSWPEKIDRGWVEYVHVRYGQSVFGGVRTQPQAAAKDKK